MARWRLLGDLGACHIARQPRSARRWAYGFLPGTPDGNPMLGLRGAFPIARLAAAHAAIREKESE